MKKLLATTALMTALIASPAMADKYVLDANGNFYDRELVNYAHGLAGQERLIVLTSDAQARTGYADTATVIRLNNMTEADIISEIGDLNRDGLINDYDVSVYVGDANRDGLINYRDYQERFGDEAVIIEQYSNLDGSTTTVATTTKKDFVPQNEGSTMETRHPDVYGNVEIEDDVSYGTEDSELSLWERFKASFD